MAEASGSNEQASKLDDRVELTTSKEVKVFPTFESMSLKGGCGDCALALYVFVPPV